MIALVCDGFIFDLDGVLVDSAAVIVRHWRAWAARRGVNPEQVLRAAPGLRTEDTIRHVAPHLDAAEEARQFEAAEAVDVDGVRPVAGAARLLASLDPARWGVATSGSLGVATARLRQAGLPTPLVLITAEQVARGKPAPDAFLLAAQELALAPSRCLVFEDAPAGIQAGLAAGLRVVGVTTSHTAAELRGADAFVPDLSDVTVRVIGSDGPSGEAPAAAGFRVVVGSGTA